MAERQRKMTRVQDIRLKRLRQKCSNKFIESSWQITGKYFARLLSPFHETLQTEGPKLAHKKILFREDSARTHSSTVSMTEVHELGFKLLPHALYSPDLAPSDFFLFPSLKIWLGGEFFV